MMKVNFSEKRLNAQLYTDIFQYKIDCTHPRISKYDNVGGKRRISRKVFPEEKENPCPEF